MFMIKPYFIFVLVESLIFNGCVAEEPDKFTYETKLLEKMIRLEVKVEGMEKEMKKTQVNTGTVLENVNRVLDNKTAELKLLEDRIELPMVAFNVYNPVDKSLDANQILILQTVRLNEGGGYDNVIGVFTAPVTGLYYFITHVCNHAGRPIQYDIVLEHDPIARSTQYNNVQHDCSSSSALTMVTAGQRVWVRCTSGNSNPQFYEGSNRQNTFSGFLLHK